MRNQIIQVIKHNGSVDGLLEKNKPVKINDEDLLQQIDQVLNFDKNRNNKIEKIGNLFRTYNKLFKGLVHEDFRSSLLASELLVNCTFLKKNVPYISPYIIDHTCLQSLKKDNPNSFLLIPIHSNSHTFSVVIRRTKEGFSATLVNRENDPKRGDKSYGQYEEYIFRERNVKKLLSVINGPRLSDPAGTDTFSIYKNFRTNSDVFVRLNIEARTQVQGNCFIKESESGLQFAFSTRKFSQNDFLNLRNPQILFKPKWEPSTEQMHKSYIKQQIKDNQHLEDKIILKLEKYMTEKAERIAVSAARKGNLNTIRDFIKNNNKNESANNDTEGVSKKNINLYAKDGTQNTSLMWAVINGNYQIARELIEHRKDTTQVNMTNTNGMSALHFASSVGNIALVKDLVKAGAEIDIESQRGETPIYLAAINGHTDTVLALRNLGAKFPGPDLMNNIIRKGSIEIIKELSNLGAEVLTDSLFFAALNSNYEVINNFIKISKSIDIQEINSGRTALIGASMEGNHKTAKNLILAGADVNLKDNTGMTALLYASENGHVDVVRELISSGADVSVVDDFGTTALILAARNGHSKVINELVKAGADINVKSPLGLDALMWSSCNGYLDSTMEILKAGANPNVQDEEGKTALFRPAAKGFNIIVELLIKAGSNVNIKDKFGKTPIFYAAENCDINDGYRKFQFKETVQNLLKSGSNTNIQDNSGKKPLEYAKHPDIKNLLSKLNNPKLSINNEFSIKRL